MDTKSKQAGMKISESEVNWDDLEGIGISREELERSGDLERLLKGEPVVVIALRLTLLGIEIVMDATLQIIEENSVPTLEICSVQPENQ